MKVILSSLFTLLISAGMLTAQPYINWSKNISNSRSVIPNEMIKGPSGSYYAAGRLGANGWLIRVGRDLGTIWEKETVGGSGLDAFQGGFNQLTTTKNGDLVVAGGAYSSDGDLPGNYGEQDGWIMKINVHGDVVWSRNYGTSGYDNCTGLLEAEDGGYYAMFNSYGNDKDFPSQRGVSDIWVAKLNFRGDIEWTKQFGGTQREYAFSWVQGDNGNITIAARSESMDLDLAGSDGTPALWLFQIDENGELQWSKTYAGVIDLFHLEKTSDNGFIVCGKTFMASNYLSNNGKDDGFIKKFDANGNLEWAKNYGGPEGESLTRITELSDGNFMAIGKSFSESGDLPGHYGKGDCWVLKVDKDGDIMWSKNIGGTNGDSGVNIIEEEPGEYFIHLYNGSFDGDFEGTLITPGATIVKLSETLSSVSPFNALDINVFPTLMAQGDPLNVRFPDSMDYRFRLFDISGKKIVDLNLEGPETQVKTTSIPVGSYIYLVEQGEFKNSGKIVIH